MRWVFAEAVSAGLALLVVSPAPAQAPSPPASPAPSEPLLTVTREPGAEDCPGTQALSEHVRRVRGQQATSATVAYHVTFAHRGGVFRASIRVGDAQGARVLRDRGPTCASLEQATALTLALLLDSDASELALEEPDAEPPPAAPLPQADALAAAGPARGRSEINLMLAAGGAGLSGVLSPIAPALLGELGIGVERLRAHVGALWVPEQTLDVAPGTLNETLLSGVARLCLAPWQGARLRLDLCSGLYAGLLQVRANGYTRNDAANKAWLAVPLELSLLTTASPIGVELGASALLPLRRNDFAIDHLGIAYESWPVGLLVSLRAVGSWQL